MVYKLRYHKHSEYCREKYMVHFRTIFSAQKFTCMLIKEFLEC